MAAKGTEEAEDVAEKKRQKKRREQVIEKARDMLEEEKGDVGTKQLMFWGDQRAQKGESQWGRTVASPAWYCP